MDKLTKVIINDAKQIVKQVNLRQLKSKTVIITGASGLIGTYFLASLKQLKNIKVIAIIRSRPLKFWQELAQDSRIKVLRGDLTKIDFLQQLPQADYIIHAAGYGQPGRFIAEPRQTLKLNTTAVKKLLENLKPEGRFLYLSSSEIYCQTNIHHSRFTYITAKKAGEAICQAAKSQGVNVKIARLSLAYGPGTKPDDQRVLNQLIAKGLKGKVSLLDGGEAKRTYGYVTDSVAVMWQILLKGGKETVYDVAGESQTTIFNLAKKISQYLKVPLATGPKNQGIAGAPEAVKVDISLMKQEFNKHKFVALADGLKQTIEWQRLLYAT